MKDGRVTEEWTKFIIVIEIGWILGVEEDEDHKSSVESDLDSSHALCGYKIDEHCTGYVRMPFLLLGILSITANRSSTIIGRNFL